MFVAFLAYSDLPKNKINSRFPVGYPAVCHECETEAEARECYPNYKIMTKERFLGYSEAMHLVFGGNINKHKKSLFNVWRK